MRISSVLLSVILFPVIGFAEEATPLPTIDCNYQFAKDMTTIDPAVIEVWSKNATTALFTFDNTNLTKQLEALKLCFTEQGWQSFNAAFQKSGNLDAIKSRQLSVSSSIKGQTSIQTTKDNQWKISLPIEVVYQNKDNKITQSLTVHLLVTRKPSGGLGILQVIATPEKNSPSTPASATEKK
jgi:hypothetical protein